MPIAEPIAKKILGQESIEEITGCIIELANVMDVLHKKGIVHRDIKPSNIYFYKGIYCFGDFGLVDYPEKIEITSRQEDKLTILELRVDPSDMGKVIGRQGKIAKSIRALMKAYATKQGLKINVDIMD